ncbi:LysM peptidoglycan-binding domain-containing protein [Alicyclobacillus acidiphilus]
MWTIAKQEGVSVQALESANPNVDPTKLQPGTKLQLPQTSGSSTSPSTYVVRPGDTLFNIAKRYGMSVSRLESLNPTVQPKNLLVGTTLRIKASSQATAPVKAVSVSSGTAKVPASADTSSNLYWMEHVIHAEAGSEPLKAQIAVGDVILHRLKAGSYGKTVKDVVFQVIDGHYQFTCVENGYIYTNPTALNDEAAMDVLSRGEDVVPGALVFYNPAKTPSVSWVRSQPSITSIGDFVFAR